MQLITEKEIEDICKVFGIEKERMRVLTAEAKSAQSSGTAIDFVKNLDAKEAMALLSVYMLIVKRISGMWS